MISNSACYGIMACTLHICSGDAEYAVFVQEELFVGWAVACACASSVTMMTPTSCARGNAHLARSAHKRDTRHVRMYMCEVRITKLRTGYRVRKKSPQCTNATVLSREKSVETKKRLSLFDSCTMSLNVQCPHFNVLSAEARSR